MDNFNRAVQQLARFPGVGDKTAARYAYWLLHQPEEVAQQIAGAILALRQAVHECSVCRDMTEGTTCRRCLDPRRDTQLICVVERPQDIAVIDASGEYKGCFHVLHGAINPLQGIGPNQLRIDALLKRLEPSPEVIIATDPDVEGDTTALYMAKLLKPLGVKVSRLAHGLSVGTELEYADRASVARALANRQAL